jgi:hypothetical protein
MLLMCQKILAKAFLDTPFDCSIIKSLGNDEHFPFFKAIMAFVFGCAAGDLSSYSKALKNFGATPTERMTLSKKSKISWNPS